MMNARKALAGGVLALLLMVSSGALRIGSGPNDSGAVTFTTCVTNSGAGGSGDIANVNVTVGPQFVAWAPYSLQVTTHDGGNVSSNWAVGVSGNTIIFTAKTSSDGHTEPYDLDNDNPPSQLTFVWRAVPPSSGPDPTVTVAVGWVGSQGVQNSHHDQLPITDKASKTFTITLGSPTGGTTQSVLSGTAQGDMATVCQSPSQVQPSSPPSTSSTTSTTTSPGTTTFTSGTTTVTTTVTTTETTTFTAGTSTTTSTVTTTEFTTSVGGNSGGGGNSGNSSNSGAGGNSGNGSVTSSPIVINCTTTSGICYIQIGIAAGGADLVQCAIFMLSGNNGGSNVCGNPGSWIGAGNWVGAGNSGTSPGSQGGGSGGSQETATWTNDPPPCWNYTGNRCASG